MIVMKHCRGKYRTNLLQQNFLMNIKQSYIRYKVKANADRIENVEDDIDD